MPTEPEDPYLVPRSTTPASARRRDPLDTIAHYESGGRNIRQNVVPPEGGYNPSVGRVTGPSSAQGPWQITNSTWRKRAPRAGIDTKQYPTAMSAPVEVQRQVAAKMFSETGYRDWAPYNSRLRAALRRGEGGTEVRQSRDDAYLIAKPKSGATPTQVTETVDDPYLVAKSPGQTPPPSAKQTRTTTSVSPKQPTQSVPAVRQGGIFGRREVREAVQRAIQRPSGSSGIGELRRQDDPRAQRLLQLQREESQRAAQGTTLDYLGTDPRRRDSRMARNAARRLSEEETETERHRQREPEVARLTDFYRQQIREAQNRGIGPEQWLNETAAKGVAGLTELAGGLARTSVPGTLTRLVLGRDPIADTLETHAAAMQRAAELEGVDRNVVSRAAQDILAGTVSSAPEMAAMGLGVPAPIAFGVGGGARAIGRNESAQQIAKATGHGVATGAAFEVPGALGITNPLAKAGTVGLGTGAIEAASGQPVSEAVKAGVTNALLAGAGELGRRGERPQLRPVEETPAQRRAVRIEATEADREAIRRELAAAELPQQQAFRQRRAERRASEVQDEAQPPVEAERAAVEPAKGTQTTVTEPPVDALSGRNVLDRDLSQEGASTSQRFFHRDFGEVTESPNQKRVGKGRVRVTAEDGTEHVIKRAAMTGRGNERAVPVREPERVEEIRVEGERPASVTQPVTEPPSSTTAAKKASMSADRAALDLPELPLAERKSWQRSLSEAKPEQATRLADEVLNRPRALSDSETASLVVRAQQVKNEHAAKLKEIGEAKDETAISQKRAELDVLEREFDQLTRAAKASGTEKGRTLAAQKLTINQDFDLLSLTARFKAATGREPTPKERTRIEQLSQRNADLEAKLAEANDRLANQRIQREIDRTRRQAKRTETKAQLDTEWADLTKQFAEIRQREAGFFKSEEGAFDPEAVKLISKMVRNRVQAGVTSAAQLVDDLHAITGGDKRELRDVISGYRTKPTERQSAIQREINALKSELRQLSATEDIAAGRRSPRQEGPAREFKRDIARQRQLQQQIADLEQQMQSGQFRDKSQREPPRYTAETYRLQKELDITRAEYERLKYKATASTGRRIADTAFGVGNVPKTLLSMGDLSALLRQGGYGSVTHPILSTRAAQDMLRSLSERGFANVEAEIKANPLFEEAKHMGVEFTGIDRLDPRLSKREEGYLGSGFIDTIAKGKLNPLRVVKGVKDVSERTFVSFLDSQRMRIYEQQANAIKGMKLTPEQTQAALKAQAKLVNIATGRGSLGTRGNAATPALNMAMFSPRLLASRVQLLNKMFNPVAWKNTPPGARKLMMIDNAKFLGFTALTLGLAKAAGAQVNLDPDDSEFLKIKIGNTRYDTLTGLQQPMRFFYRMAMAMKGGETYAGDPAGDIMLDFTRSKASPEAGYLWDAIEGKNRLSGKKFEAGKDAVRLAIPLPMQDFQEAIKADGAVRGFVEALPSIAGVGSQTYKGAAEKPTTHAEKLARRFIIRKMPDEARTQEEIDVDAKKSELRLRARRGEDVRGELAALGSKITEKQAKGILAARNQSRLHEDVNRLGIKEALLVYSVANPQQRVELKPLLTKKASLVSALSPDEQQKALQQLNQFGISGGRIRISRPSRESRATR